jgi:hypothetical protein
MPEVVLVRNLQSGPTVFTDKQTSTVLEWAGAGDPKGEDVRQVPDEVLRHPNFVQSVRKGVFEVERMEAEEADARLTLGYEASRAEQQAKEQAVLDQVDVVNTDNDIIGVKCLISGEEFAMRAGDLQHRPPLSDRFAHLAGEFQAQPTGTVRSDGTPEVTWVRAGAASSPTTQPTP